MQKVRLLFDILFIISITVTIISLVLGQFIVSVISLILMWSSLIISIILDRE